MIRNVNCDDAEKISEIYSYYVNNTSVSFELTAPDSSEMKNRIIKYTQKYPWLVYEIDGNVVGYAYASKFREREAYKNTVELSVYFLTNFCGKGYGKEIVSALIKRLKEMEYYTAIAGVTYPNEKSEYLFRSLGFEYVGIYKNVGYKKGKWHSVMEFLLPLREYD